VRPISRCVKSAFSATVIKYVAVHYFSLCLAVTATNFRSKQNIPRLQLLQDSLARRLQAHGRVLVSAVEVLTSWAPSGAPHKPTQLPLLVHRVHKTRPPPPPSQQTRSRGLPSPWSLSELIQSVCFLRMQQQPNNHRHAPVLLSRSPVVHMTYCIMTHVINRFFSDVHVSNFMFCDMNFGPAQYAYSQNIRVNSQNPPNFCAIPACNAATANNACMVCSHCGDGLACVT
jgi:hypothetical protein